MREESTKTEISGYIDQAREGKFNNIGDGVNKWADVLDKDMKLTEKVIMAEEMEQDESSDVIRSHGWECKDESETEDKSAQCGDKAYVFQQGIMVDVVSVPNEEERRRDVRRDEVVDMSSDEHR